MTIIEWLRNLIILYGDTSEERILCYIGKIGYEKYDKSNGDDFPPKVKNEIVAYIVDYIISQVGEDQYEAWSEAIEEDRLSNASLEKLEFHVKNSVEILTKTIKKEFL